MECIYTLGTSSTSHTYGNVASFLMEKILSYFPQDYFKYTRIASKIAWRDIRDVLGNENREFKKRHYPFLTITPRFSNMDNDRFGYDIPLTKNMDNLEAGMSRRTLHPVIHDRENRIMLAYKLNRDRLEFDVEIQVESAAQQLDLWKNLQNQMNWDRTYFVPTSLESMIPKSMIEYIGKMSNIDITNQQVNTIPIIIRHLNRHSKFPITYKVASATQVDSFFMFYTTKLSLLFTDLQIQDGNKRGMVDESFTISFRVVTEFNLPGMYALIGTDDNKYNGLRFDMMVGCGESQDIIPFYTVTNLYDRFLTDPHDGFNYYNSAVVRTDEENDGKPDAVDLKSVIEPMHMSVLESYIESGVSPNTLFRFKLLKDSVECPYGTDDPLSWSIDWKRKTLTIRNSDKFATYRIVAYANMMQINNRAADLYTKLSKDKPGL